MRRWLHTIRENSAWNRIPHETEFCIFTIKVTLTAVESQLATLNGVTINYDTSGNSHPPRDFPEDNITADNNMSADITVYAKTAKYTY